jgi:hypothetical protein
METQANHWLPLTEYALRSGMSISTLRRKIKSNTIDYKMEEGRYLIRSDDLVEAKTITGFVSSDSGPSPRVPHERPLIAEKEPVLPAKAVAAPVQPAREAETVSGLSAFREELLRMQTENRLCWRAIEARVSGLAKNLEIFSEQIAEVKMLVKIFEEKLDRRG